MTGMFDSGSAPDYLPVNVIQLYCMLPKKIRREEQIQKKKKLRLAKFSYKTQGCISFRPFTATYYDKKKKKICIVKKIW